MQAAEDEKMDHEDGSAAANPLLAEIEAETASETDPKNKPRRYWTSKEEERFFEIWGRDNWRLTRHGKNTLFFADWSKEMKERFDIDVKQEEIQAKVNQTRAKFRQVKKQLSLDSNAVRWKKYDIIERILKNQYRPKDAEPIPQEALARNRDISAEETMAILNTTPSSPPPRQSTPTSITSNSTQDGVMTVQDGAGAEGAAAEPHVKSHSDVTNSSDGGILFNATGNDSHASSFNTELFTDHDDVKREFDAAINIKEEEFQGDYPNFQYQQPEQQNHYGSGGAAAASNDAQQVGAAEGAAAQEESPQLHQLQTPQQQLLAQTIQQQLAAPQLPPTAPQTIHSELSLTQHVHQLQQQQVTPGTGATTNTTGNYDHSTATTNSYANQNSSASQALLLNNQNQNQNHYATPIQNSASAASVAPLYNTNTHGSQFSTVATTPAAISSMPPPPRSAMHAGAAAGAAAVTQVRKRRTSSITNNNINNNVLMAAGAVHLTADSIESMYLEEVRRKNQILDEQKDISRKRLHLEERKLTLMEQFFPKCLELQEQILQKLNST